MLTPGRLSVALSLSRGAWADMEDFQTSSHPEDSDDLTTPMPNHTANNLGNFPLPRGPITSSSDMPIDFNSASGHRYPNSRGTLTSSPVKLKDFHFCDRRGAITTSTVMPPRVFAPPACLPLPTY